MARSKTQYWLMKSEPDAYSIDQLKKEGKTPWDGIRNYQARNLMMSDMQIGDQVLFYHSNAKPPGVIGLAEICSEAKPDVTALDKKSKYYDAKASEEKPIWHCVDVKFKQKFDRLVSLDEMKSDKKLDDMMVVRKGMRLSIQPVSKKDFDHVCKLAEKPAPEDSKK